MEGVLWCAISAQKHGALQEASKQLAQNAAKAEHVCFCIVAPGTEHLWSHIHVGPCLCCQVTPLPRFDVTAPVWNLKLNQNMNFNAGRSS